MNIRFAQRQDLEQINSIYNQAVASKQTAHTIGLTTEEREKWFKAHSADSYPVIVYENENKITGWLSFSPYREGRQALRKTAEISFYVDQDFRRKGIGTSLLETAKRLALDYSFNTLFGIILETNLASIYLMQKCGFKQWGFLPGVAQFGGVTCGHLYFGLKLAE